MQELLDFLYAQLAEDERVAREAGPGPWLALTTRDFTGGPDSALDLGGPQGRIVLVGYFDDDPLRPTEAEHIARWDPARVLAEVEAKRRIVDLHHPIDPCDAHDAELHTVPCDTLLALAQPYAGRPGWRTEWSA